MEIITREYEDENNFCSYVTENPENYIFILYEMCGFKTYKSQEVHCWHEVGSVQIFSHIEGVLRRSVGDLLWNVPVTLDQGAC